MKLFSTFAIVILLGIINLHASSDAVQKKHIRYIEKSIEHKGVFQNQGIPSKPQRLSNNEGNIVMIFDKNLPDSLQIALNAAKKLWESKIPNKQPIYIAVSFEPLENDISMIADVTYTELNNAEQCPSALAAQILDIQYGNVDSPDGIIIFNSNIDWNCSFSAEASLEYNLPTIALRGITRCLGFGSSIIEENEIDKDKFMFSQGYPSSFDKLLYCNGVPLSNLDEYSAEMAKFATSDNVYAIANQAYKIYAPEQFVPDMSLRYFDDNNSLMSYSFGKGHIDLSIDEKTIDVLKKIGWNLTSSELQIICNDISENGVGSSYSPHTFSLLKNGEETSNHNWKFSLKDKSGNYILISSTTTENFTIAKISNPQNYYININGDLEGRIECDYTLNGKRHSAIPFQLSLELKPSIRSIEDITIIPYGSYGFYLTFNVSYVGADCISVEIEEEYDTTLRDYCFYEPYFAHIKTGNISNLYYSWVTVIVSNKYGSAYETLEYSPIYKDVAANNATNTTKTSLYTPVTKSIQLCNVNGLVVFDGTPSNFLNQTFQPGLYIKKEILNNGSIKTSKILIK